MCQFVVKTQLGTLIPLTPLKYLWEKDTQDPICTKKIQKAKAFEQGCS